MSSSIHQHFIEHFLFYSPVWLMVVIDIPHIHITLYVKGLIQTKIKVCHKVWDFGVYEFGDSQA